MAFNKTYLLGFLFFGPFLVNLAILFFSRFIIDFFQWNTDQYTSDILTRAASMGFCLSWVLAGLTIRYSVQRSNSGGDSTYRQYDDLGSSHPGYLFAWSLLWVGPIMFMTKFMKLSVLPFDRSPDGLYFAVGFTSPWLLVKAVGIAIVLVPWP